MIQSECSESVQMKQADKSRGGSQWGERACREKLLLLRAKSQLPSLLHLGKPAPLHRVPPPELFLSLRQKSHHKQKMKVRNSSLRKEKMRLRDNWAEVDTPPVQITRCPTPPLWLSTFLLPLCHSPCPLPGLEASHAAAGAEGA